MNKGLITVALGAAIALTATGCSAQSTNAGAPDGATLRVAISGPIDSWNPTVAVAATSFSVFPQVFGSLLTRKDAEDPGPGLASSYEFDAAGKTLTLTLDKTIAFSDGTDLTSADVAFSAGLWKKSDTYGSYFDAITTIETPDEDTVRFRLSAPDRGLLAILTSPTAPVVPKNLAGRKADDFWKKPIGAGPYAIAAEKVGQSIDLVANAHDTSHPDRPAKVRYVVVADAAQQLLQFQSGQIDIVNTVDHPSASQYDAKALQSTPSSGNSVLIMQTKTAPFDDRGFRRAIALALDSKKLVSGAYGGRATAAKTVLPGTVPGVEPCDGCTWNTRDIAEAKRLIAASGYDGRALTLNIASDPGPDQTAAQAIVPMLKEIGVPVTIAPLSLAAYVDNLGSGKYDFGLINYNAGTPTAGDPLGFLASTGMLFTGASTTTATATIDQLRTASTPEETAAATKRFERWAYDESAIIPIAVPDALYAVAPSVAGFTPDAYRTWRADDLRIKR